MNKSISLIAIVAMATSLTFNAASAVTLIDTGNGAFISNRITDRIYAAAEFTLPIGAEITEISLPLLISGEDEPEPVVNVQITSSIGPGTLPSSLIAEFDLTVSLPPSDSIIDTSLFLDAGTYYLVLSLRSDPIDNAAAWPIRASVDVGRDFQAAVLVGPAFPPASQFVEDPYLDNFSFRISGTPISEQVGIDIQPFNTRNVIFPRARGRIWVAILADTDPASPFDRSSQVDIPTVEFGPGGAKANHYKLKDINKDGLGDLLLRFKIPETGIACGDTEARLTGETFDGLSFTGTDSIRTVGCKPKKHHKEHHH